mmetsp:Transcript_4314/g.7562  ORF Transcript_4314/g.7562 Transcript_4314/m.7562 type:complete len:352 (-) Transcript_4314:272-1327(-)
MATACLPKLLQVEEASAPGSDDESSQIPEPAPEPGGRASEGDLQSQWQKQVSESDSSESARALNKKAAAAEMAAAAAEAVRKKLLSNTSPRKECRGGVEKLRASRREELDAVMLKAASEAAESVTTRRALRQDRDQLVAERDQLQKERCDLLQQLNEARTSHLQLVATGVADGIAWRQEREELRQQVKALSASKMHLEGTVIKLRNKRNQLLSKVKELEGVEWRFWRQRVSKTPFSPAQQVDEDGAMQLTPAGLCKSQTVLSQPGPRHTEASQPSQLHEAAGQQVQEAESKGWMSSESEEGSTGLPEKGQLKLLSSGFYPFLFRGMPLAMSMTGGLLHTLVQPRELHTDQP